MIGIFDSGSGGLTVLRALREELPSADVVYFGDIKHAPYGPRPRPHSELSALTVGAIKFLRERGAGKIISACNSVSASMALSILDAFAIEPAHIIEMVGPTVAYFRGSDARILLCATEATISSGIYQNAFGMVGKAIAVVPLQGLADAIEFARPRQEIKNIIEQGLRGQEWGAYDALVLACTHYPLVLDIFTEVVPARVVLFDPARAVAARAAKQFWPQEVGDGTTRFYISKESQPFRGLAASLFPGAPVEVVE